MPRGQVLFLSLILRIWFGIDAYDNAFPPRGDVAIGPASAAALPRPMNG
jgi:hypothetical protein